MEFQFVNMHVGIDPCLVLRVSYDVGDIKPKFSTMCNYIGLRGNNLYRSALDLIGLLLIYFYTHSFTEMLGLHKDTFFFLFGIGTVHNRQGPRAHPCIIPFRPTVYIYRLSCMYYRGVLGSTSI